MILLEVVDAEQQQKGACDPSSSSANQGLTRRQQETSSSSATPSAEPQLPDYDTSQAEFEKAKLGEDEVGASDLEAVKKRAKWKERRLTRWIVYALAIYFILSVAIAVPLFLVLRNNAKAEANNAQQAYMQGQSGIPPSPSKDLPPDLNNLANIYGDALQCNDWTTSDNSYDLQYSLPVNESLYIRSNYTELSTTTISPMSGFLTVSVSDDANQTDALISVSMNLVDDHALAAANVCTVRISGVNGGWGLAIYVPNDGISDKYQFSVDLSLPQPVDGELLLSSLATYLPSFNQTFGDLESYAGLPSFIAQGSGADIYVESVHASAILVKTSAAGISGTFNASDNCFLETVLAPINATVSLYNGGGLCPPTQLEVETGNSDITLNVTLYGYANATEYSPPTFLTGATTFSGNLQAIYHHDSELQSSALYVRATSSINPAAVYVDDIYQGTYDVHTSLANAYMELDTSILDPSGLGRQRKFDDEFVSTSRRYGWVNWGPRPTDGQRQGHIEVQSSLGDAILQLTSAPDTAVLNGSTSGSSSSSSSDGDDDDDDDEYDGGSMR